MDSSSPKPISHTNIALIGMPGSGKTTLGRPLAHALNYDFVDNDHLTLARSGYNELSDLVAEHGREGLLDAESDALQSLQTIDTVIATGGSVIYREAGMQHLASIAHIIYLEVSLEELTHRLGDLVARGVALKPNQTLQDLYNERRPLYEHWQHTMINCDGKSIQQLNADLLQIAKDVTHSG